MLEKDVILGSGILCDLWEYDPQSNVWSERKSFPRPGGIVSGTAFSIGGKGYVGLGIAGYASEEQPGGAQADFYEYDPVYNKWTQLNDFAGTPREEAIGFEMNGKGYVGLGWGHGEYNDFWEYNPATDSWKRLPDFPGFSESATTAFGFGIDSCCYIGIQSPSEFYKLDLRTNKWEVLKYLQGESRFGGFSFCLNNTIYQGGGMLSSGFVEFDLWAYNTDISNSVDNTKLWSDDEITVYPNPANNELKFRGNFEDCIIVISDIKGNICFYKKIKKSDVIPISTLSKGIYVVRLIYGDKIFEKKLIKQ